MVDPPARSVAAYRSSRDIRLLRQGDDLDLTDVLPGLVLPVMEIFER
jgi:hypothetical protein